MQSCVIDGLARDFNGGGAESLAGVLGCLNTDLAKDGRFIKSLRVNGREVADIDRESARRLDGVHSLEITTESRLDLARNIIAEGEQFIGSLQDYLIQTAGHSSRGSACAGDSLVEAVQGLDWFVRMIGFIEETLHLDFHRLARNGKSVAECVKQLNAILQEIINAQEKSDAVLLADILEYDLAPHLEEWKGVFTLFEREAAVFS